MTGENVSNDGELSLKGLDLGVIAFVLRSVCELHVEGVQNLVQCACSIADEAAVKKKQTILEKTDHFLRSEIRARIIKQIRNLIRQ